MDLGHFDDFWNILVNVAPPALHRPTSTAALAASHRPPALHRTCCTDTLHRCCTALHHPSASRQRHLLQVIVIVGYILGLSLMAAATVTLEAAMASLLVCFGQHPSAFESRHPHEFGQLVTAWAKSDIGVPDWVSQASRRVSNQSIKAAPSKNIDAF